MTESTASLIRRANQIPLQLILKLRSNKSHQIRCPFKERHEHGDATKSARFYSETNSIHCFTEGKSWNPVALFCEKMGRSAREVAEVLLAKFGPEGATIGGVQDQLDQLVHKEEDWHPRRELYEALADSYRNGSVVSFILEMEHEDDFHEQDLFEMTMKDAKALNDFIKEGLPIAE